MTPERWERAKKLFQEAVGLPPAERGAFLARACAGDDALRGEVEKLLRGDGGTADSIRTEHLEQVRKLLELPADAPFQLGGEGSTAAEPTVTRVESSPRSPAGAFPGYDIAREISRGGQGVVYEAVERAARRKVAIKILLEGHYASEATKWRFRREIEVAASLKHPHIVSILHAGETTDGRLYYVMDYVAGAAPLHRYARERNLPPPAMLHLFVTLCETIQFAHQRGVIHRDLKPQNVLVDREGRLVVLDFGLAKWLFGPVDKVVSHSGFMFGTLDYMSPEQARGRPEEVDTRTDVYSLGVMLYELLTGGLPYPASSADVPLPEMQRQILETPPTPPQRKWVARSAADAPDSAAARGGRAGAIKCPIDNTLSEIVLRALEKKPEQRYQSAAELAGHLRQYLAGEPVDLHQSLARMLRKSLRRHQRALTALLATFAVILLGGGALWWRSAERQKEQLRAAAERQRQTLQRINEAEGKMRFARTLFETRTSREHLQQAAQYLKEARALSEGIAEFEELYSQRALVTAAEGLYVLPEEREQYVRAALDDFHRAHLAAGGAPLFGRPPDGWNPAMPLAGPGSPAALRRAVDFLTLIGDPQQARNWAEQARPVPEAARGTPAAMLPAIYKLERDPLVGTVPSQPPGSPQDMRAADETAVLRRVLNTKIGKLNFFQRSAPDVYVTELLFEPLFCPDENLQYRPNPALLRSEPARNGKEWTLELRPGLLWHDGKPLEAADIEFTWWLRDHWGIVRPNSLVSKIEAVGPSALRVTLTGENPRAAMDLNFLVLPRHLYEAKSGDEEADIAAYLERLDRELVGSGPFRADLSKPRSDVQFVLKRWDKYEYAEGKPLVAGIEFHVAEKWSERLKWLQGQADEMELWPHEFAWTVNGPALEGRLVKVKWPRWGYDFIGWNNQHKFFKDVRVRQAMTHALDLDAMRAALFGNLYDPCRRIICDSNDPHDSRRVQPASYDPAKALALLDAAGWKRRGNGLFNGKDSFKFTLLLPEDAAGLGYNLKRQLADIGVAMELNLQPGPEVLDRLRAREFDAVFWSVIPNPHPSLDAARWNEDGGANYVGYVEVSVKAMFEKAFREPSLDKEFKLYQAIQQKIYADQPYTFLWQRPALWAFSKRMGGVRVSDLGPAGVFLPGPRAWWAARERP